MLVPLNAPRAALRRLSMSGRIGFHASRPGLEFAMNLDGCGKFRAVFQLNELNRRARAALPREGFAYRNMKELEAVADDAVARLRQERLRLASTRWERLHARLERRVDTDVVEYLDRSGHPEALKLRQIRWLHRQNVALRSYHRFLRLLSPAVSEAAAARAGAPARLLELGSGSGELSLALARLAARMKMPVAITGSDIVPAYVKDANERARAAGVPAHFRELNAFDLSGSLKPGDVDVAFIVQSIHHFSPGQLAMMVAQVGAAGARRFIGIDGRRGLLILGGLPAICSLSLDPYFVHDAFVSVRRLYADAELELVASIAAPDARVSVRSDGPFISVLTVDYTNHEAFA